MQSYDFICLCVIWNIKENLLYKNHFCTDYCLFKSKDNTIHLAKEELSNQSTIFILHFPNAKIQRTILNMNVAKIIPKYIPSERLNHFFATEIQFVKDPRNDTNRFTFGNTQLLMALNTWSLCVMTPSQAR